MTSCRDSSKWLALRDAQRDPQPVDDVRIVTVDVLTDDVVLDQWVEAAADSGRHEFGDRDTAFSADELRAAQLLTTGAHIERLAAVIDGVLVAQATLHLPLA